jgi:hypothetical protein
MNSSSQMNSYSERISHHFPGKAAKAFSAFLALSFFATFTIYLLLITSHLFYGRTYLLDTGFWIGLSTGEDPTQLIEPSGINGDLESYFNTHFSPIFSALQIIYLPFKSLIPPAGYFLLWFTSFHLLSSGMFALALSLAIKRYLSASWSGQKSGSMLVATALAGSYWLAAGSSAYIISYSSYPHTEIIGLQLSYIGLFMLIIYIFLAPHSSDRSNQDKSIAAAGLVLIVIGSLFHELVALISMFNLTVFLLTGRRIGSHTSSKRAWINRKIQIILGMIGLPLLGWALLRRYGYFIGDFTSSLNRIYVGNHFDHLSFERYLTAFKTASAENATAALILLVTTALSLSLLKRGLNGFFLYLMIPIGYFLASPAAVNNSAATLTAHYGYPMISVFYLFPISLAVTGSLCQSSFTQNGSKSIQLLLALPLLGTILLAGYSMQTLLRKTINIPDHCTPTPVKQEAQQDTCIKQPRMGKVWFNPSFVVNYVMLGLKILQQADNTFSRLGYSSGKLNRIMSDEQLTTLYPNRFHRDNVLATEEQFALYQKKKIPKRSYFIRYHITDSLYVKDILPLLAKNGFRLVAKTRVGDFGSGVVYEYVWANFDGEPVN